MNQHLDPVSVSQKADELEESMMHELERVVTKSTLHYLAEGEVKTTPPRRSGRKNPGKHFLMGADPRLPPMPAEADAGGLYFRCRFASHAHLLQSATHALKAGHNEKGHSRLPAARHRRGQASSAATTATGRADDRALCGPRSQLGGAHASRRCAFSRTSRRLAYPEMYLKLFGDDISPSPTSSPNTSARGTQMVHDVAADLRERHLFVRSERQGEPRRLRRHHRPQLPQPEEGLGLDDSPSAHMWRTMMWPNRFLVTGERAMRIVDRQSPSA
jgi:hypothetical protein